MGKTRAKVTSGVDGVACEAAKAHADGDDDAEYEKLCNTGVQFGNLSQAEDREDQNKGADHLTEEVAEHVGDSRAGREHAELGARFCGGVKLILEENVHEAGTDKRAGDLRNNVAGDHGPIEAAVDGQRDGQGRVEAGAGSSAEHERGKHDRQAPGQGDLNGAGALHTGFIKRNVGNDAVAQQDQEHSTYELCNIR